MKKIFCISGLGADHRIFKNIYIAGFELVPVPWLPIHKTDNMSSYALRLAQTIPDPEPIILGLSLGGMLATEIRKQQSVSKVIIISSAKTKKELGYNNKLLVWLSRINIVPNFIFNKTALFQMYFLGASTKDEKSLMKQIIRESDPTFVKHAIDMLLNWCNDTIPKGITHIHGTADRVIYPKNVHPDYWIKSGSLIMIYNKADEVNMILKEILSAQ